MRNKIDIGILIKQLNEATDAYNKGHPIMSDAEWDNLYFELKEWEEKTSIIFPDSPTQTIHFTKVSELKKVKHNHPMLSLDKTKELDDIQSFVQGHEWIAMAKMDGLTCSLRYINGKLVSAETRGNGIIGEDVTHNAMVIPSIPKHIPFKEEFIVDGEIICAYKDFEFFKENYKNPRNFASGSIRLLDSKECKNRHLTFVAWDIIKGEQYLSLTDKLTVLKLLGFKIAPYFNSNDSSYDIEECIVLIKNISKGIYPIDGIVFKYDDIKEYEAAGRTDHHFKGGIAYKFYDDEYETEVKNIEWTMGRTGQLTPVLVYNDIEIDGTICNRASLHNISVMKNTMKGAFPGQRVYIYKANQIIPQVAYVQINKPDNVPLIPIPKVCPYCGSPTEIRKDYDSEVLYCTNPTCSGKLINRLDHFCGKKGLDIKGLSKRTLEKLIDWGWVNSLEDIFNLSAHQNEWIKQSGFGITSVDKILKAIEEGRNCNFETYLCAIGIPLIGKVASKALMETFYSYNEFRKAIDNKGERLYQIDRIGEVMINNLLDYDYTEADTIFDKYINEIAAATPVSGNDLATTGSALEKKILNNKNFVITGRLQLIQNRKKLKSIIEQKGGKVTESISSKTDYLVCNDKNSTSSKMKKAKSLNIQIISEQECLDLCNE